MLYETIWDFWANRYERLWVQKYSLKPTRDLVINELKNYLDGNLQENLALLDVGCGTGQLLEELQQKFSLPYLSLTGIDKSQNMIVSAENKLTNVKLLVGDALDLPFRDNYFDFLTCCHSFPYYPDKLRALQQFKRVVKPGGFIFLVQASENNVYDKLVMKFVKLTTGQASYPSKGKIKELVQEAGFSLLQQKRLKKQFYMPSIILSILQNGEKL